jgi:hypothetical protein
MTAMKKFLRASIPRIVRLIAWVAVASAAALLAQSSARITAEISNANRSTIPNSHPPMARAGNDMGSLPQGRACKG